MLVMVDGTFLESTEMKGDRGVYFINRMCQFAADKLPSGFCEFISDKNNRKRGAAVTVKLDVYAGLDKSGRPVLKGREVA
jgi:hypothetical protein